MLFKNSILKCKNLLGKLTTYTIIQNQLVKDWKIWKYWVRNKNTVVYFYQTYFINADNLVATANEKCTLQVSSNLLITWW